MAEREGAVKGVKIVNGRACLYCQGCARYLGTAEGTSAVRLKCPVCKHESAYRVNVAGVPLQFGGGGVAGAALAIWPER